MIEHVADGDGGVGSLHIAHSRLGGFHASTLDGFHAFAGLHGCLV